MNEPKDLPAVEAKMMAEYDRHNPIVAKCPLCKRPLRAISMFSCAAQNCPVQSQVTM
jgi:ribosomal protein L34E